MAEQRNQPPEQPEDLYDSLKSVEPRRPSEPDDTKGTDAKVKTMEEMSAESPKLSDLQSALQFLLPKLQGYLNIIQVGRVFPDIYNPLLSILVKDLLADDDEMSVATAIAYANTALSIGIDGEGRIDVIGLYGRASETEVEKEKAKAGLP